MQKVIIAVVLLFSVLGPIPLSMSSIAMSGRAGISWEAWLPAIAQAESDGYVWAVSKKGAHHGRGKYQISEIALQHYIWEHPGTEWMEPKCLFNTNIARVIALWYLNKASRVYDEVEYPSSRFAFVLSAYNVGIAGTLSNGINHAYVSRVYGKRRYMVD